MQISCCKKEKNVSAYAAANETGWAGCCLKGGRTWPVDADRAQEILKGRGAASDG